MCACVQPPPYMLGERPTPLHGGSGALSFRQVPFVRVNERVENGIKVRKQLRKYLKTSSTTQHLVAQMHLQDASVPAMQPHEVSQSCFEAFFVQMKTYNQIVGQKHLEASKALVEMARPLDNSGKSKKWSRDVYNLVQRCVQDVNLAEKKMDKSKTRKERADEELAHWKKVLEANEATYQVQPNNPEVQRAYQLAQYRFINAFTELEAATAELEETKGLFYAAIERRDQVVEEATELSQSMEEDRMETMLIVMKQFVETKKMILQAEIEAISSMQRILSEMDKESVIQQYIVDAMQPDLTHRQAKALYLLEWHRTWHSEQVLAAAGEPSDLLALSAEDAARIKSTAGISSNDVEVIKDFVVSCFVDPDKSILSGKLTSTKHRSRFTDPAALGMYRIPIVRRVVLQVLHHQRTHSLELSTNGFFQLATALLLLLDACAECDDAKTIKSVMNMAQTFYKTADGASAGGKDKEYLLTPLLDHTAWNIPQYWGNALLLSIGEELSKNPQETAWYYLGGQERAQLVLQVHNMVFGQVTSFIYNLQSFGFSRRQIQQYVQNVCFAYEVSEDQRIAMLQSVNSLEIDEELPSRHNGEGEEVQFTSMSLPDWTYLCTGMYGGEKLRVFRTRTSSTSSDARTTESMISAATVLATNGPIKDLEEMKLRATALISSALVTTAPKGPQESWQDLFGSAPPAGDTSSNDGEPKKVKTKKNSRKFNEQLRLARGQSVNARINGGGGTGTGTDSDDGAAAALPPPPLPPTVDADFAYAQPPTPASPARASFFSSLTPRSTASASTASASAVTPRKQSMDDTSMLLVEEKENRRRTHGRLIKARSAATIDTSSLRDEPRPSVHVAQSPIVALGATASKSSSSSSSSTTGMDIRNIAAQMKKRREASGSLELAARASMSAAIPSQDTAPPPMATPTRLLRKTHSSRSMQDTLGTISDHGNGKHSHGAGATAASSAQSALTGVAAMRARFEKK